ncbi:hypothetical protein BDB01DRAFT_840151 [Pilobolus umbonatus]|nr:hypothetical protein BDB01DRAFT_840151 [Pilobolus umbonatus]
MSLLTILMSRCIPCQGRVQADISVSIRDRSGSVEGDIGNKKGVSDGNEEVECTVIWAVRNKVSISCIQQLGCTQVLTFMYRDAVIDGNGDVDLEVECTVIRSAVVQHMVNWFICINNIRRIERCLMGLNEYGDQLFSNDQSTGSTIIYHLIHLCSYPLHPARGFILIYDNHSHWLVLSVYGLHRRFYSRILPFQKKSVIGILNISVYSSRQPDIGISGSKSYKQKHNMHIL